VSAVAVRAAGADPRAIALAQSLHLPLIDSEAALPEQFAATLAYVDDSLQLFPRDARQSGPVCVDFCGGANRHRLRGGAELIVRAVRGRAREPLTVIDATAGLGRDSFILAGRGFDVTLLERSPVIAALLADGLRRARAADDATVATIAARMTLHCADATSWLDDHGADVIYLDPMFPDLGQSALAKKEMQLFQQLLLDRGDEAALLQAARAAARLRVVVKRPRKAPPLAGVAADYALEGRSVRFDVYVARIG
jgi:16S rRNA (guanine1516-N2)-methyltransferase